MISRIMRLRALWFALAMLAAATSAAQGRGAAPGDDQHRPQWQEAKEHHSKDRLDKEIARLSAALQARGYEVGRGSFKLFTIEDCKYPIAVLGNCLGNNPAAPYIIPIVPLWADEYVDRSMKDLLGPVPDHTSGTFRLDKREAVLIVGLLPPPARYFGLQTYVFTRKGSLDPEDPVFQATLVDPVMHNILFSRAPDPSRVLTFSSIGNSNNNAVIERKSGAAFNRQRSFVISTDAGMAREMTEALVHARIATPSQVFGEPVSDQVARLGLDAGADDFMTLIRYAQPVDKRAGDRWRHEIPLAVLRVRDKANSVAEPWPKPAYDPKTARPERWLGPDLAQLVAAVKQQWRQPAARVSNFQSLQTSIDLIGQHCLLRPMNCLGNTQDADYQISPSLTLDDGKVIAVAGALGTATGNATYVGLSVNWLAVLKGVANLSDEDMQGTADGFSRTVRHTGKLYLRYFARDCSGIPSCQQITEAMVPRGDVLKDHPAQLRGPGHLARGGPAKVAQSGGDHP